MLLQQHSSGLVLIDVQEKLTPHVLHADKLVTRCAWLMRLANALSLPILVSEQYPSGLGQTVPSLKACVTPYIPIEKVYFSCYRDNGFMAQWQQLNKKQMVIMGIETHVCVLQTAIDVKQSTDCDVFVVVDAVSSRSDMDHRYGLKRMKQAGIELVTSEMVFFEWVRRAGTTEFKALSQAFLQGNA